MFKKLILSLGVLSAVSTGAMASEAKGVCGQAGVVHNMVCYSTSERSGAGVSLCYKLADKKHYADVTGIVAQGGRRGVVATYVIKEMKPVTVGGSFRYVDRKTSGKSFELSLPMIAPTPHGGRVGVLEIDGRRQPEMVCNRTR